MKVKELIAELQAQDPEATVAAGHLSFANYFSTFNGVYKSEHGDVVLSMKEETVHADEVEIH